MKNKKKSGPGKNAGAAPRRWSEETYQAIFDNAGDAIFIHDDKGRILMANMRAREKYGYTGAELLSMTVAGLDVPDEAPNIPERIGRLMAAGSVQFETRHHRKDGSLIWVDVNARRIDWAGRPAMMSVCRDVTDRKRMEEELKKNEEKYKALVETTATGFLILNSRGEVLDANDEYVRLSGHKSFNEIAGRQVTEWTAEHDRERNGKEVARCLGRGHIRGLEVDYSGPDGKITPVEIHATVIGTGDSCQIVSLVRDIAERREAERARLAGEARYRTIFESISVAMLFADIETGEILGVNRSAETLFGRTKEELVGMNRLLLHPADEAERYRAHLKEHAAQGKVESAPATIVKKDGTKVPVEISASALELDGKKVMQGFFVDVSERKKMEESARAAGERYRLLAESAQDAIFIVDREMRLEYINNFGARTLGKLPGEVIGKPHGELFPPEVGAKQHRLFHRILESGLPVFLEEEVPLLNERRWLDTRLVPLSGEDGRPRAIMGVARDITARKNAEEEFRDSYEIQRLTNLMLQRSLENLPLKDKLAEYLSAILAVSWMPIEPKGAVFVMDGTGGSMTMTAQQGLPAELIPCCGTIAVGKCLCGRAASEGRVVSTAHVGKEHEISYKGMSDHGHYCAPIMAGARVMGVLCLYLRENAALTVKQESFIKAVTGILASNIIHSQVEAQLIHSQKMESVGRLAGGVAHDFNNLVTAINGYAQIVMSGLPPEDARRGDVQEIIAAGNRAATLTRQLLAFSRKQMLKPVVVDLNSSIDKVSRMLERLMGENIRLELRPAERPCPVKVDPGQIDQVLMNFAVNSRDAMPRGGIFRIRTEVLDSPPAELAERLAVKPGPLVMLSVSDNGVGMSKATKEKLFEPFFSTKEAGKGTGLGLSMVYGIVKQSGGGIEVESSPGRGAEFSIYFPLVSRTDAGLVEQEIAAPTGGGETVLIVEDEESLLKLAGRVLSGRGYTVLTASTGTAALAILRERAGTVSLLLTDMLMPGMDGVELARQASAVLPGLRTLYMSGYTQDAVSMDYVMISSRAFIQKPFTPDSLALKVRLVLDSPADKARP